MSRAQRWTVWTLRKNPDAPNKKPSKVPVGRSNDPSTWSYFHACRACLNDPKIAGLGFEMYARSGIIGIDIDKCIEGGIYNPLAQQLLAILEAAGGKFHVEITPSGVGLRIFAAETPLPFHDFLNNEAGLEVYAGESARFLTFTGAVVPGFGEGPFHPLPPDAVTFLAKYATKMKEGKIEGTPELPQEPVPDLTRRDDWEKLHPQALKRLSKEHRDFLHTGALGARYASASEQLFAIEQSLLKHIRPPQAYQILISADGSWGTALEHREGSEGRAKDFIWQDIQRAAVSKEKHDKEKAASASGWKECDIVIELCDDGARAKILQLNIINAFQKHDEWINRLGFNTFDGRVTLDKKDVGVRELAEMSAWLCEFLKWQYEPRREIFEEAVIAAAKSRPWNPIEDELRGLVWDGKSRIAALTEALVENPEPIDFEIMKKWVVGYIARGLMPGCQLDTILCLREAEGGAFKTTFCRVMAGEDRYTGSPGFGSDKDSAMLREGMRIIELGEGVAARKADKQALKDDVTRTFDHFRPPWGRTTERRPRGSVYVLTANDDSFLRSDQDGLRRFWPVTVRSIIDIEWVRENRDQVLAEAVALHTKGEEWWWNKGEEPIALVSRQLGSVSEDFLDASVVAVVKDSDNAARGYVTLAEAKKQVEAVAGITLSVGQAQHLIDIMRKHGMRSTQRRVDGFKTRLWEHDLWKGSGTQAKVIEMHPKGSDCPASSQPNTTPGESELLE